LKKEKEKKAPDRKEVHLFRLFHYFMGGERTRVVKKEARSQVKFSIWGGEETAETAFKFSICIKKKN
jgi:hypothetical protein